MSLSSRNGFQHLSLVFNLQSDVIVNTISEDLDLSKGAVSRALLNTAGPQLQAEICSTMREFGTSRLNPGDLVPTNGYNLHCQKVFQTVCPFWNGGFRSEDEVTPDFVDI